MAISSLNIYTSRYLILSVTGKLKRNENMAFLHPYRTTTEAKLRWFQFRLLHKTLITNKFMYKINKSDNERCTFCRTTSETLYYLFWDCNILKMFWSQFLIWIATNYIHDENLKLNTKKY